MGLDMYLTRRTYVKNYENTDPDEEWDIEVKRGGKLVEIDKTKISYIEEEVAYWRKVNALHRWFVENCQDGVDDCRSAYVSKSQLSKLLENIKKVLAHPDTAKDLLPTMDGFFFGDTAYDDYYFDELKETEKILEELLKPENERGEYYYQSSW